MSAGNEAAPDAENAGGRETLTDDRGSVAHPTIKINGKPMPPAGHAWENGELVPVTMPPGEGEEITSERLEFYRVHTGLWNWAMQLELSPKAVAVRIILGQELRSIREIAKELDCSERLLRLRVAEARAVLAELQGEAVPLPGAAKP